MNEFHHQPSFDSASGDPLERFVEAFVDQSVPMGPDAAVQRRLLAAMSAASLNGGVRPAARWDDRTADSHGEIQVRDVLGRSARVRAALRQSLALAVAIALVVTTALLWRGPAGGDQAMLAMPPQAGDATTLEPADIAAEARDAADSRDMAQILAALDVYLQAPRQRRPDRQALEEMLAAVIRENPEFARSEAWREAQQRLAVALEQPQVLSMGVGLLGTLSWTTYGRF